MSEQIKDDFWAEVSPEMLGKLYAEFDVSRSAIDEAFSLFESSRPKASETVTHAAPPPAFATLPAPAFAPPTAPASVRVRPDVDISFEPPPFTFTTGQRLQVIGAGFAAVMLCGAFGGAVYLLATRGSAWATSPVVEQPAVRADPAAQQQQPLEPIPQPNELARNVSSDGALHAERARALTRASKWREAAVAYETAVAAEPDNPRWHHELGKTLIWVNRSREAEEQHREAVRLEPANPEWHNGLGMHLEWSRRIAEAEGEFAEAVRLDPKNLAYVDNLERIRSGAASW